jgi:PKHD-type hydroxylase
MEPGWASGKRTAALLRRGVKENLQVDGADPRAKELTRVVEAPAAPLFEIAAPSADFAPTFSRYDRHDLRPHRRCAHKQRRRQARTDLAFTIFLAERESYEGGELVVDSALGEQGVKLEAGDAFLYSAGSIHHVAPVSSGARLAAVGWVQSFVPDLTQRDTLFDLSVTRGRLAETGIASEELLRLDKSISNLLRMWAR